MSDNRAQYDMELERVVNRLRRLANDVVRAGQPSTHLARLTPDCVRAALAVQREVLRVVSQLGLDELVRAAVAADHVTAVETPGALLDRATTALAAKWYEWESGGGNTPAPDGWMLALAEATLRGAGVLRPPEGDQQ